MMQIQEIVLYNPGNQKRTIKFEIGKLNIITGKSNKGKSAIISIVQYCFGSNKCNVAEGVIRENVSWYGLLLKVGNNDVFIARQAPASNRDTTKASYVNEGSNLVSPDSIDAPNTDIESVKTLLEKKLGFGNYIHEPQKDHTRDPLEPTIRHTLGYCFQKQTEIANNEVLFHGHSDNWVLQAAKDTIPYFLGVFREDYVILKGKLRVLRRELKSKNKLYEQSQSEVGLGLKKGLRLLEEAKYLGVIESESKPNELPDLVMELSGLLDWTPAPLPVQDKSKIMRLQNRFSEVEDKKIEVLSRLDAAKSHRKNIVNFTDSSSSHEARLMAAKIFSVNEEFHECPLCSSTLEKLPPTPTKILQNVESISSNLTDASEEIPKIDLYISEVENEFSNLEKKAEELSTEVQAIINQNEELKKIENMQINAAKLIGRVESWVESVKEVDDNSDLQQEIQQLEYQIAEIEEQLEDDSWEDRLLSIQNRLSKKVETYAKELQLDYSDDPIRIDLKKLTVISDREDRPIELKNMGSAENWLGYHLSAIFPLKEYFINKKRPIPSFLILDQPSQVYFPRDLADKTKGFIQKDVEREAVKRIYKFMFDRVEELDGKLQLIVMDHAEVDEDWFNSSIRESWWEDNQALIPIDWITE